MRPTQKSRHLRRYGRHKYSNPRMAGHQHNSSVKNTHHQHDGGQSTICGESTIRSEEDGDSTTHYCSTRYDGEEDETLDMTSRGADDEEEDYDEDSRDRTRRTQQSSRGYYEDEEDDGTLTLGETALTSHYNNNDDDEATTARDGSSRSTTRAQRRQKSGHKIRSCRRRREEEEEMTNHNNNDVTLASAASLDSQSTHTHNKSQGGATATAALYRSRSLLEEEEEDEEEADEADEATLQASPLNKKISKSASQQAEEDDPYCILSIEPDSQQGDDDDNDYGDSGAVQPPPTTKAHNTNKKTAQTNPTKKTHTTYIITEPTGSILDNLIDGKKSSHGHQHQEGHQYQEQQQQSLSKKSKSHQSATTYKHDPEDRLACSFSVEPMSPLSEMSSNATTNHAISPPATTTGKHNVVQERALVVAGTKHNSKAAPYRFFYNPNHETACDAMHAMLDHYLPSDISEGPMHGVLDQYLPSFPSRSLEDDSSSNILSNSSTTHPLRFVNELVVQNTNTLNSQNNSIVEEEEDNNDDDEDNTISTVNTNQGEELGGEERYHRGRYSKQQRNGSLVTGTNNSVNNSVQEEEGEGDTGEWVQETKQAKIPISTDQNITQFPPQQLAYKDDDRFHDNRSHQALKRGLNNKHDNAEDVSEVSGGNQVIHNSLTNTSIQIYSPKYRGWKPEELEVVLLERSSSTNHDNGTADGTAISYSQSLKHHLPKHYASDNSLTSSHIRDLNELQLELAGTIHEQQDGDGADESDEDDDNHEEEEQYSDYSSNFSVPGPGPTFSYDDVEDDIRIPEPPAPSNRMKPRPPSLSVNTESAATPLSTRTPTNTTPAMTPRSVGKIPKTKTPRAKQKQQRQKQSSFSYNTPKNSQASPRQLIIRGTRSEEAVPTYQTKSYLDTIVEQIDPVVDQEEVEDKENQHRQSQTPTNMSSSTDIWQSSLDSLRQLKARSVSQRHLLTSLIAERNGAKATASTANSKMSQWSDTLREKDAQIEGLRRQNHTLRVQVAHIQATKVDAPGAYEVSRKLHFLNKHGAPVEKHRIDPDSSNNSSSRLYQSERAVSSELVEIEQCMFELRTKEVTTLEVSDQPYQPPNQAPVEQRDDVGISNGTDHEIQIAISKIVAKETAALQQRVQSLETQLETKLSTHYESIAQKMIPNEALMSPPENIFKTVLEKTKSGLEKQRRLSSSYDHSEMDLQVATEEKESAVAKWKSESNQRDTLSKSLDKAQLDMKTLSSQNDKLAKQLADSLSANQSYRERLTAAEKELKSHKTKPGKISDHKEKSLKYYKRKVQALEEDMAKLQQGDGGVLAEAYKTKAAAASRNEIRSLREHVESLQRDYSAAEEGRMEAATKVESLERELEKLQTKEQHNPTGRVHVSNDDSLGTAALKESFDQTIEGDGYIQHYKRSVFKLEQEIAALRENEKVSSETARAEMSSLRELVEKLRGDYEEAQRDRNQTSTKYREIEKELKKLRRDYEGTENDRLRTAKRCKDLEQELETTISNLESTSLDNEEVTMRADQLYAAKEECDEKIANLEAEIVRLKEDSQRQISERDGRIKELKDSVTKLETELRENEKQVTKKVQFDSEALDAQLSKLQLELRDALQERDDSASDLQAASNDLVTLRSRLDKTTEEKSKLASDVQQLQVTKEDYECRVSNLMEEMSKAQNEAKRSREEKKTATEHYSQQIASLESQIEEMKQREIESSDQTKQELASREETLTRFKNDLETTESERDELLASQKKLSRDLERTQRDLESRILDNTELSLRVEQLYAAKEEREEKIATIETMLEERTLRETETLPNDSEEELLMSKMRIATLEDQVKELKELAETEREVSERNTVSSDDVYVANRERQEALAKCSFLTKENEKLSDMLESTRSDLSRTIIEISRLEMDLDDARNDREAPQHLRESKPALFEDEFKRRIDHLVKQNAKLAVNVQQSASQNRSLLEQIQLLQSQRDKDSMGVSENGMDAADYSQSENKALMGEIQRLEGLLTDARMQIADQQKTIETEPDSEKQALLDEIKRLQKLHDSSKTSVAKQQDALARSHNEILELRDALARKSAQDWSQSSAGHEAAYLRRRVSEMEQELTTSQDMCRTTKAQNQSLTEQLSLVEREASHFRIQISEMEEKLFASEESLKKLKYEEEAREAISITLQGVEAELNEKQKDVERLSSALDSIRSQEKESADAVTYKNDVLQTYKNEYSKMLKKKDGTMKKMAAELASSRATEAKLRKSLKESHERDRRELLILREQVSSLQNDISYAEEARKKLSQEKESLSAKLDSASKRLEEKESEVQRISKLQRPTNTAPTTTAPLASSTNDGALEKQELSARLAKTVRDLDDKEARIDALSQCLDKAASDKEKYLEEMETLRKEVAAIKFSKTAQPSISSVPKEEPSNNALEEVFIIPDLEPTDSQSRLGTHCCSVGMSYSSDMSAVSSKMSNKSTLARHTILSQSANDQLALAQKREEEVSRTTVRKLSLLEKEITKLAGNPIIVAGSSSFDERSQLSNSGLKSFASVDSSESMEYDLDCRLKDVTQMSSSLELLLGDKKKSQQKLQALYKINAEYLDEIKDTISEQDDVVDRQGAVIETLNEELAALKEREKKESRTLISEISLLEENISHLQIQFDSADIARDAAEDRFELAMRERQSLEFALKQSKSEKEHLQKRLPKVSRGIKNLLVELEDRVYKLKAGEFGPEGIDQNLVEKVGSLKKDVEEMLSYLYKAGRKDLRVQTLACPDSDGDSSEMIKTEYFMTLNDYDYQLLLENMTSKDEKLAIKVAASSENKFLC